eukprot:Platyproteum_vivax@DN6292_c0_g1_i1.p1
MSTKVIGGVPIQSFHNNEPSKRVVVDTAYPDSIAESFFNNTMSPWSTGLSNDGPGLNRSDLSVVNSALPMALNRPKSRYALAESKAGPPVSYGTSSYVDKVSAGELEARVSRVDNPLVLKGQLLECNKERIDTIKKLYASIEDNHNELATVKHGNNKLISLLESQLESEKTEKSKMQARLVESQKETAEALLRLKEEQARTIVVDGQSQNNQWVSLFQEKDPSSQDPHLNSLLEKKSQESELLSDRVKAQKLTIDKLHLEVERLKKETENKQGVILEREVYLERLEAVNQGKIVDASGAGMVVTLQQERKRLEHKVLQLQDETRLLKFHHGEAVSKFQLLQEAASSKPGLGLNFYATPKEHSGLQKDAIQLKEKNIILEKRIGELKDALLKKDVLLTSLQLSLDKTRMKAGVQGAELLAIKEETCPSLLMRQTAISDEVQMSLNLEQQSDKMLHNLETRKLMKVSFVKLGGGMYKYGTQIVSLRPTQNQQTLTVQFGSNQSLPIEEFMAKFEGSELSKSSKQTPHEACKEFQPQWTSVFQSHWSHTKAEPPTFAMERMSLSSSYTPQFHNFGAQEAIWPESGRM